MKTCLDCLQDKPESEFYTHKRSGSYDVCKGCICVSQKLYRVDPEAYKELKKVRKQRRRLHGAPDHKECTKCHVDKPLETGFRVKAKGLYGHSSWCLECERQYNSNRANGLKRDVFLAKRRQSWVETPRTEEKKLEAAVKSRVWYAQNKERAAQNMKSWVQANRAAYTVIQARRRANKLAVVNDLTIQEWEEILETFNHSCAYCLRSDVKITMDHMHPISKGGAHTKWNIVPACKNCNSKKKDRSIFVML